MSTVTTSFHMVLRFRADLDRDTSRLLDAIFHCHLNQETALSTHALPAHPFFSVPNWFLLFQTSRIHSRDLPSGQLVIKAVGQTALLEQDVSLFLRWLQPYLAIPRRSAIGMRLPQRIAVLSTSLRPREHAGYFIDGDDAISMDYVDGTPESYRYHLQGAVKLP